MQSLGLWLYFFLTKSLIQTVLQPRVTYTVLQPRVTYTVLQSRVTYTVLQSEVTYTVLQSRVTYTVLQSRVINKRALIKLSLLIKCVPWFAVNYRYLLNVIPGLLNDCANQGCNARKVNCGCIYFSFSIRGGGVQWRNYFSLVLSVKTLIQLVCLLGLIVK